MTQECAHVGAPDGGTMMDRGSEELVYLSVASKERTVLPQRWARFCGPWNFKEHIALSHLSRSLSDCP